VITLEAKLPLAHARSEVSSPHIQNQILAVLDSKSGISQKAIILATGLSERCIRNNLKFLEQAGLISSSRDFRNLNFKRYKIRGDILDNS